MRLQIGNDSNGWMFTKKGLATAAGIAPFFLICKKKKGLETAAGIAPIFLDFCSLF